MTEKFLKINTWLVAGLCLIPIFAVFIGAFSGTFETWQQLVDTVLPRYILTTLALVLIVGVCTTVIGTATAWFVTLCDFPLRRFFTYALALPLAFPAYVLAYAYTDFLDHPGAVQTLLRDLTGWGARDYWFPEIRSLGGAAAMLTFVLYPYVYLLARSAFLRQSPTAYFAARTLGHKPLSAFLRVSLPTARPAIVGGMALVLMETIADFGTVSYFGVQTFATGIYTAWFSFGDRAAAAQLALCLLIVSLVLVALERRQRGLQKIHSAGKKNEPISLHVLSGGAKWGVFFACALPVIMGFILPLVLLLFMSQWSEQSLFSSRYWDFAKNSLTLATIAAVLTVSGAMIIGFCRRLSPGKASRFAFLISGIGYAVPGTVIAVGLLVPFSQLENALDAIMRERFDISTGLFLTGSAILLVLAYIVRFMAAALNAFDSGISQIKPNVDAVARSLGSTPQRLLRRVHLPLLRTSLLTALLIVFVDVMKELPATLFMRPFNFDTLAVQAFRLASDERLNDAAIPALAIVGFGLLPVLVLTYTIRKGVR